MVAENGADAYVAPDLGAWTAKNKWRKVREFNFNSVVVDGLGDHDGGAVMALPIKA